MPGGSAVIPPEGSVLNGVNITFDYVPKIQGNRYFATIEDFSIHDGGRKMRLILDSCPAVILERDLV